MFHLNSDERTCLDKCSYNFFSGKNTLSERYLINKKEKILKIAFIFFSILTFVICSIWLYCWAVLSNESLSIEEYIYRMLTFWCPWYVMVLIISVLICIYLMVVVFSDFVQVLYNRPLQLCLCHKIAISVIFIVSVTMLCVLGILWPGNEQWRSVTASLDITSPFLQLAALFFWVLFSIYLMLNFYPLNKSRTFIVAGILYLLILFFLLCLPFFLYSPCIGKKQNELVKPLIIGHRGAPSLAPENTMLSFKKAVEHGVYALETDVRVSSDGVAFLMHDDTLFRTTNVAAVFPTRKYDRAETFTWSELRQLNSGEWYLHINPYSNKHTFSQSEIETINAQKIPSLKEFLSFAAEKNVSIVFDIFQPPRDQLYFNNTSYVVTVVMTLRNSNLPASRLIFPMSNVDYWKYYRNYLPGFRFMSYNFVPNATAYTIDIFNLHYSVSNEAKVITNVSTIQYVVDSDWAFSRAWCQEIWAVTTNYCAFLSGITEPLWVMSSKQYFITWSAIDILALITVGLIWCYCRKKLQAEEVQQISRVFNDGLLV